MNNVNVYFPNYVMNLGHLSLGYKFLFQDPALLFIPAFLFSFLLSAQIFLKGSWNPEISM